MRFATFSMSRILESVRYTLEEVDNIEQAVADRLARNPDILGQKNGEKKRSYKQTILQQHEVKFFDTKYKRHCTDLVKQLPNLKKELDLVHDPKFKFDKFDEIVNSLKIHHEFSDLRYTEDLKALYSMYPNKQEKRVKRKDLLSQAASHLNLDEIFTKEEKYGKQLDMLPFYDTYKILNPENSTYLEYLQLFHLPLPQKLKEYEIYLKGILDYLVSFIKRSQPFNNVDTLLKSIDNKFNEKIEKLVADSDGQIFCKPCNKLFKETIYKNHLTGKKHLKNVKNGTSDSIKVGGNNYEKYEFLVDQLSTFLQKYRYAAISNTERYLTMSEREKMIEMNLENNDLEYTNVEESSDEEKSDEDEDIQNLKDLPLGVDGKPMPYWLYKIQGLNKIYSCEICGNISFKGRMAFNKHFGSNKHQYGLKCLGVTPEYMNLFVNIDKIDEASALWIRLKRTNRIKEGDQQNAVEVEDDEGNVMSEKDYLDLKKQGLL